MKIYISGKISGLPIKEAQAKFNLYAILLRAKGYEPVNPMTIEPIFEAPKEEYPEHELWALYMAYDIKELFSCEAIYMLKDWGQSKGARVEYAIAKEIGIKIYFEEEFNN